MFDKITVVPFLYDSDDDLLSNTYVVYDHSKKCVVIDPSKDYSGIINFIKNNKLNLQGVLLTHTHFDHMRGVDNLVKEFNVPLYVGFDDIDGLKDIQKNCSDGFNVNLVVEAKPEALADNQRLSLIKEDIVVLTCPYHTIGSVSYYLPKSKLLFSGDCLFKMTIGRADLPTSYRKGKAESFKKLMSLDDTVKVFPGHGRFTTIGDERKLNPFIKY